VLGTFDVDLIYYQKESVRGFYLSPPSGSSIYHTEESAIADAPILCPDNTPYLCWYDSRNPDNDILFFPPSIDNYDVAIFVCFALMGLIIIVGAMIRLGCCCCIPLFEKPPKSDTKSNYSDEKKTKFEC